MKRNAEKIRMRCILMAVLSLLTALTVSWPCAEGQQLPPHYAVTALGTLGGDLSNAAGINDNGFVFGDANLPGNANEHATVWRNGVITDLGTLGGPNSSIGFVAKPNDTGLITGNAQTGTVDPLGENWGLVFGCAANGTPCQGSQYLTLGFAWQNGTIRPLPTLGGNNALAFGGANEQGQIVGTAETATRDPNCIAPQVLDLEAVVWGPKPGEIQEFPPLPGDSIGIASGINDVGQVIGATGICGSPAIGFSLAVHAVLWQNGSVTNLGSLGGVMNNVATAINNRGQVVGLSDLAGDATAHAFLWQDGVMTDLGTVPGDFFSVAYGINDKSQVVGQSCDVNFNCRAFVWENGVMTDLNTLISSNSSPYLLDAEGINSSGEIVGNAFDQNSGDVLGFLAFPKSSASETPPAEQIRDNVILPEKVRRLFQHRGFGRFGRVLGVQ